MFLTTNIQFSSVISRENKKQSLLLFRKLLFITEENNLQANSSISGKRIARTILYPKYFRNVFPLWAYLHPHPLQERTVYHQYPEFL